ncbi:MAG: nucleotide exchange factor GrpE, partial [Planctomycetaceae bacterium]|nr:nucleotide exchange factor GrpE [Planctomycetaceae bacterium]
AEAEAADELVEPTESDEPVDLVVEETAEEEVDPLTAMTREKDEVFAQLQRVSADYQNYMRRAQHNQRESAELARADVIKTLLGVLDHFDHALSAEAEGDEAKALMDGVRIVHDELMKVLTQSGLGRVEPAVGDAFDPEQHEALMRQSAEGVEANHITAALQPGYRYGRRTLRAAKVAVAPESE